MSEGKQKIAILGAGAVGRGLAQVFCKRNEVALVGKSNIGPLSNNKFNAVFITVKAFDNLNALASISHVFSETLPIVVMSNGLGVFDECYKFVSNRAPLIRGLINTGFQEIDGQIQQIGPLKISLSTLPQYLSQMRDVEKLFLTVNAAVTIEPSIALAEWKKVLLNSAVNSVCTVFNGPNRIVIENEEAKKLAIQVFSEVRRVAATQGVILEQSDDEILNGIGAHGDNINSTLRDVRAGRPNEMQYLLGRVIDIAKQNSTSIPTCETLYLKFPYS